MEYVADWQETSRLIVNNKKKSDTVEQIVETFIKDGKIHVITEERKSRE